VVVCEVERVDEAVPKEGEVLRVLDAVVVVWAAAMAM